VIQKLTIIILHHQTLSQETIISTLLADEVIIIHDSSSNQKPPSITNPKIKIYSQSLKDFASQRNFALTKAKNDWVMFLDADEVISKELALEITSVLNQPNIYGYYFYRLDNYYGQILRFGEIGQTKILRLARKNAGQWQRPVHETWLINGNTNILNNPLIHYRPDLVNGFFNRFLLYCPLDSKSLNQEGKPFSYFRLFFYPLAKFIRNYYIRLGFLDGTLGLFHAYLMSLQSLTVRIYQREKVKLV
jgi:hypothetical protein